MPESSVTSLSTRALEVFATLARTGSLQETALALGMSAPAASQQLKKLETTLGQALIDHARRPLEPTPAGHAYLVHVRAALDQLRQGTIAVALKELTDLARLRLGVIDDLDDDVSPELASALAGALTRCELSLLTAPSQQILEELSTGTLDFGIAARSSQSDEKLVDVPLLRDPFLLAVPRGALNEAPRSLTELATWPFLRYGERHAIGRQIAAELGWRNLSLPGRVSVDSNRVLFALIAGGQGWAITTALGFCRARHVRDRVDLHPLPFVGFSRTVCLYRGAGWQDDIPDIIADTVRDSLRTHVVEPMVAGFPWLDGMLSVPD